MLVYALCRDRNERAGRSIIPDAVLEKPPSAELRPDQRDSDSLPDYAELDPILEGYVEDDQSIAELVAEGHDPATRSRASRGSSTATSTSAARRRPACACRRRRSARTGGSRSPTAGRARPARAPDEHTPEALRRGRRARRGRVPLRRHVPARPRRARRRHAVRVPRAAVRGRGARARPVRDRASRAGTARTVACSCASGSIAGVLLFGGYATQTVGLQYTSPSTSAFITGLYVMFTPFIEARASRVARAVASFASAVHRDRRPLPPHGRRPRRFGRGELLDARVRVPVRDLDRVPGWVRGAPAPDPVHDDADGHARGRRACRRWRVQGVGELTGSGVVRDRVHRHRVLAVALSLQLWGQRRIPPTPRRAHPADGAGVRRDSPATSTASASARSRSSARS